MTTYPEIPETYRQIKKLNDEFEGKEACIQCFKICDKKDMKMMYSVHANGQALHCKECYEKYS